MRLYHDYAYHFDHVVESYWQASAPPLKGDVPSLAGEVKADVVIIGAGFTGLNAAYKLVQNYGLKVVVLEAGIPGWGASGRNGGFCCLGSAKLGYAEMIQQFGLAATQRFHQTQKHAVDYVAGFLDEHNIDAQRVIDGDVELAHKPSRYDEYKADSAFMAEHFGEKLEILDQGALKERGMVANGIHGGLYMPHGFGLHPLRYVRGLADLCLDAGAEIYGHSEVSGWQVKDGQHIVRTANGHVTAKKVFIACNGYLREDLHRAVEGRFLPALSRILVTRPIGDDALAAQGWTSHQTSYDSRVLLHYFRLLPDKRFLFGGRGGVDASPAGQVIAQDELRRDFHHMFPAWSQVEISHSWSGLVCLARGLVPVAGALDGVHNAYMSMAYHGNGVAMGSYAGMQMAAVIVGDKKVDEVLPQVMTQPARRYPLAFARLAYLRLGYMAYRFKDYWL